MIKNSFEATYSIPMDVSGLPSDARITDLDLYLNIDHQQLNDLNITLYSPTGQKAQVLTADACKGQQVPFGSDMKFTFNDQAYDINIFNQTGTRVRALFTCTNATSSIGAYNQGHMKPQGDELKIFNGLPINSFVQKNLCFTAAANDINPATNRFSSLLQMQDC